MDEPAEAITYFTALVARRAGQPGDGLLDELVAKRRRGHPIADRTLTEWDILAFLWAHVIDSSDSTSTQLGNTVLALLWHDMLGVVRAEPALIPHAVEAALWWNPAFPFVTRRARRDVEMGGARIRAGDDVIGWLSAANRSDELGGTHPFEVRGERRRHLSFGGHAHMCIGAALARRTLAAGLGAFLDLVPGPIRIVEPEPTYRLGLNNSLLGLHLRFPA